MFRTNLVLRLFDRIERPGCEKSKYCRTETGDAFAWHQYHPTQHISVNLIEHVVLLRNATGIDHALYFNAMFRHSVQNNSRMECSAFNCGEQFVLRGALQVPTECNASQIRVHQNRTVAVVPGHTQKTGLPRPILLQPLA